MVKGALYAIMGSVLKTNRRKQGRSSKVLSPDSWQTAFKMLQNCKRSTDVLTLLPGMGQNTHFPHCNSPMQHLQSHLLDTQEMFSQERTLTCAQIKLQSMFKLNLYIHLYIIPNEFIATPLAIVTHLSVKTSCICSDRISDDYFLSLTVFSPLPPPSVGLEAPVIVIPPF